MNKNRLYYIAATKKESPLQPEAGYAPASDGSVELSSNLNIDEVIQLVKPNNESILSAIPSGVKR